MNRKINITIDQYLNGNPQTRIKQIQFFAYGSNSQKSILDMGQDFISYSGSKGNSNR